MKIMNLINKLFVSTPKVNLKQLIDEGAFLVDVRTAGEFASGHIKGSVNIPLDKISAQIVKFNNKKNIIVFCRSGARSAQAKNILQQHGVTNVINGGSWDYVNQFVK
ncbi:MAG TPA: rhodanese-like domain-containing protein [Ferruginibacter sp.]|nr:rhodanese-like domain-containing protein [Ferruginibacter sp.]